MSPPLSGPVPAAIPLAGSPVAVTAPDAAELGTLLVTVVLGIVISLALLKVRRVLRGIARNVQETQAGAHAAIQAADRAERTADAALRSIIEVDAAVRNPPIPPGLLELRDTVNLVARRAAFTRRSTRVLFLVHLMGVWDSYHALVRAMADADDFEPIVASIPRQFRGAETLFGEEDVHRGLQERGVPHLRFSGDAGDTLRLIKAIDPDVIFRQSQWDADIAGELSTERLGFARTCLVPYETMNIVANVPDARTSNTAVDSEYHRAAWLVFCANEMMLDMAVHDGARDGAQFRAVGHPKADHLRAAAPAWPIPPASTGATTGPATGPTTGPTTGRARPGRVVWSAHHSIATGWTDFGAFHLVREEMLAWAEDAAGTEFVFMPHPALLPFPGSEFSPISRRDFDAWMASWTALPNTAVLSEADYGPALAASDLMVTDGLSMLVEYQLFGKPLIFLERDGHRPFNAIGEQVVQGVHTVHTARQARAVAERFLAGEPDPLRERQRDITRQLFGTGDSATRIVETLRREIDSERGRCAAGGRERG